MGGGGVFLKSLFSEILIWNNDKNYREHLTCRTNLYIWRTKYPLIGLKLNLKKNWFFCLFQLAASKRNKATEMNKKYGSTY